MERIGSGRVGQGGRCAPPALQPDSEVFGEADELDIFFSPRPSVSSRLLVFARGIFLLLMSD